MNVTLSQPNYNIRIAVWSRLRAPKRNRLINKRIEVPGGV